MQLVPMTRERGRFSARERPLPFHPPVRASARAIWGELSGVKRARFPHWWGTGGELLAGCTLFCGKSGTVLQTHGLTHQRRKLLFSLGASEISVILSSHFARLLRFWESWGGDEHERRANRPRAQRGRADVIGGLQKTYQVAVT